MSIMKKLAVVLLVFVICGFVTHAAINIGYPVSNGTANRLLGTDTNINIASVSVGSGLSLSSNSLTNPHSSYGQGADITNGDSAHFSWFQTNTSRNGSLNVRTSHFTVGDTIMLIAYSDNGVRATSGAMTIQQILDDLTGLPGPLNYFMEVSFDGDSYLFGGFSQIPFNTLAGFNLYDPGSNWDGTNYWYTVPSDGIYQVVTKLRVIDGDL